MNTPNLVGRRETDALRARLRPCVSSPRPIPCPGERQLTRIGGGR
jgi:hypothetical protein